MAPEDFCQLLEIVHHQNITSECRQNGCPISSLGKLMHTSMTIPMYAHTCAHTHAHTQTIA